MAWEFEASIKWEVSVGRKVVEWGECDHTCLLLQLGADLQQWFLCGIVEHPVVMDGLEVKLET